MPPASPAAAQPGLRLADGTRIGIEARHPAYDPVVACLAEAMRLSPVTNPDHRYALDAFGPGPRRTDLRPDPGGRLVLRLGRVRTADERLVAMNWAGTLVGLDSERRGGMLLHAALCACRRGAVLLAGPGGVGKTTACRRLPPTWEALGDDAALVLPDGRGGYRAHPWPSWSRFLPGGPGGRWSCGRHLPLRAIFLLVRDRCDTARRLGGGQAAGALLANVEQATAGLSSWVVPEALGRLRRRRLDNVLLLAGRVPCYRLGFTRDGPFWEVVETVLGDREAEGKSGADGEMRRGDLHRGEGKADRGKR